MASASTVAVVVPSPAMVLVLVAASLTSCGPEVLVRIIEVDVLGHGHAVLGHLGRAPSLVQDGVAAARTERACNGPGQLAHAGGQRLPGFVIKEICFATADSSS